MERLYNGVWSLGVRFAHMAKRVGIPGSFERLAETIALRLIPLPKQEAEISLPGGLRLIVPPGFPRARTYAHGGYEREVTGVVCEFAKEGMRVVDVGAFCGYYALLLSSLVGASGRIYAFEPHPTSYAYLVRNVTANACGNVITINKAVADRTGTGDLVLHAEADHHWLAPSVSSSDSIQVQTITLDDFFAQEGWPDVSLLKIDVEGSEYSVLQGMQELSKKNPRMQLIIEYDARNLQRGGATWKSVASHLQGLGFHKGYIIEQGRKAFSVAKAFPALESTYNLLLTKE